MNMRALLYNNKIVFNFVLVVRQYLCCLYRLLVKREYMRLFCCSLNPFCRLSIIRQNKKDLECLFPHDLVLIAICKNEAEYLPEWIEYHLMLGIEHFYLYNNNSNDNYNEVLDGYIKKGILTLIEWPEIPGQLSAYLHWNNNFRDESNWATFIDIDEFICPRYKSNLKDWIAEYSRYPVVVMYWQFFCSSGKINHESDKPVIEQYFTCFEKPLNIGKIIFNTRFDLHPFSMGMWHFTSSRVKGLIIPPVNIHKNFVKWDIHKLNNSNFNLLLNHYWSKSYDALLEKKGKGASAFKETYITDEWFWRNDSNCVKVDYTIYRFLLPLKLRLINKNS